MSNRPIGTPHANYATAKDGPFRCDQCVHFVADGNHCDHPDVQKDAEAGLIPKDKDGAVVEPGGCCTYFRPRPKLNLLFAAGLAREIQKKAGKKK